MGAMDTPEAIERIFTYHAPEPEQTPKYDRLRREAKGVRPLARRARTARLPSASSVRPS